MALSTRISPLPFDSKMSLKYFLLVLLAMVALATPSFGDYPKPPPHEPKPPTYMPPKGGEKPLPEHKPPMGEPPKGGEKPPMGEPQPPKGGEKPPPEHKPPMGMPPKGEEKPPKMGEKPPPEKKPPTQGHYPGHNLMENVQDFGKPPRKVMPPMSGPSKKPYGPHKPKSPPHSN
ncbi:early nodulin-75-like [Rhododendron vialii]|uniref:early nodulin-75-like n=1 Tax=Rhododendron vialii TaxID=182163 RepID=UPI00265F1A12|nr:early nodulin-75-like [Rhododendron vialii]